MKKRLNIGLFVSNLVNDFDIAVYRGVERGAQEMDANLIVFPGRYLKGQYNDKERTQQEYQYNTIFSYADRSNLDVLLVLLGTIGTVLSEEEKKMFLDMFPGIPIIILADDMPGYKCLVFDNRSGLKDGITDLIVNKERKNIGMVSGPLTNEDAIERLNVYKETLQEHGLEASEDKIVYGNFSEYSEEIVEDLISRNPGMDAIVFANDQMAIGGYKVLKNRKLTIGEDVLVMGFDDSPMATVLVPNLSTVRADALELGRRGAIEAVEYVTKGDCECQPIKTELVLRESTGGSNDGAKTEFQKEELERKLLGDRSEFARELIGILYSNKFMEESQISFVEYTEQYIVAFLGYLTNEISYLSTVSMGALLSRALAAVHGGSTEAHMLIQMFDMLLEIARIYAPNKEYKVEKLLYSNMTRVTRMIASYQQESATELDELLWMSNSVARDMLAYGESNDQGFDSVLDKLIRLGFKSGYLYLMDPPFVSIKGEEWYGWKVPDKILLKAYFYDAEHTYIQEKDKQSISTMEMFTNPYIQNERRHTLLANIIFINEEQLGILFCEIEPRKLQYLKYLNAQLGAALKIIHMMKVQVSTQKQLEDSLEKIKESNQILETISKIDELTGIYNRRGFFEMATKMLYAKNNQGKKAILVFADLDNLKSINDKIGHEEGDFAIRSAARILTDAMSAGDVVARIGGDEFVAMTVVDHETEGMSIKKRIKQIMEEFNEQCEKKYYIGISAGYSEFTCNEDVPLEEYLGEADEKLYEDKQKKRKNVMKEM